MPFKSDAGAAVKLRSRPTVGAFPLSSSARPGTPLWRVFRNQLSLGEPLRLSRIYQGWVFSPFQQTTVVIMYALIGRICLVSQQ